MIDADKIKLAHELADKTDDYYVEIILGFPDGITYSLEQCRKADYIMKCDSIDPIIDRLEEMTKTKTKDAWYIKDGVIKCTKVSNRPGYVCCDETDTQSLGRHMYDCPEAAVQGQIAYWKSLSHQCDHETGPIEFHHLARHVVCVKCGIFIHQENIRPQ